MKSATGFPIAASVVGVLLAIGTAVTAFGLWHLSWPEALAIKGPGLSAGYLYFLAACAVIVGCVGKLVRVGYETATVLPGIAIVVLAGGVWPLLAVAFYLVASLSLGHLVLKRLSRRDTEPGKRRRPHRRTCGGRRFLFPVEFPDVPGLRSGGRPRQTHRRNCCRIRKWLRRGMRPGSLRLPRAAQPLR